jgi:hypothetical protein
MKMKQMKKMKQRAKKEHRGFQIEKLAAHFTK